MLLDTIATVILIGMMLIPFVNVVVGIVVGAGLAGVPGALLGLATAIAVIGIEKFVADRQASLEVAVVEPAAVTGLAPQYEEHAFFRRLRVRTLGLRKPVMATEVHVPQVAAHTLH